MCVLTAIKLVLIVTVSSFFIAGYAVDTPTLLKDPIQYYQNNFRQAHQGPNIFSVVTDGGLYTRSAITLAVQYVSDIDLQKMPVKVFCTAKNDKNEVYIDAKEVTLLSGQSGFSKAIIFSDNDGSVSLPNGKYVLSIIISESPSVNCIVFPGMEVEIHHNMPL